MTNCKECAKRNSCTKPLSTTGDYKNCADFAQKKMTRFERIKQMSVEEMAEWIGDVNWSSDCITCCYSLEDCGGVDCSGGIKQWLMQEVEGE